MPEHRRELHAVSILNIAMFIQVSKHGNEEYNNTSQNMHQVESCEHIDKRLRGIVINKKSTLLN